MSSPSSSHFRNRRLQPPSLVGDEVGEDFTQLVNKSDDLFTTGLIAKFKHCRGCDLCGYGHEN